VEDILIEITGLTKVYGHNENKVLALRDVNLSVKKGEIFGIIGLSGAGKSTLIRCINRLEKPTSGIIKVDGQDIGALSQKDLRLARQKIAMIFQHFNLLSSRNVFDNILFPLEIAKHLAPGKKRVTELLDLVGLSDKATVFPEQLSGGQNNGRHRPRSGQ
jgi:D-methionine transport system ATP-binding protein